MECAQATRALPFPFGRKRKQKGPFCTARRQQKDRDTLRPVRRDAQKLAASRRSNNLCARFFAERVLTCLSISRCRSAVRGGRGGQSPARVSLASFSLHRAKRMKSRQRNLHNNLSFRQNHFVKFRIMLAFFDCLDKGRRHWNALRPRGPFLFRSAGKGSKRGRFARHVGSGKLIVTNQPVRRDAQKLAASRRSNNLCARFFTARGAMKKSPHEPRSE